MKLRLAILLTALVATSAYAMRPLPDHIMSTNIIDMRGETTLTLSTDGRSMVPVAWHFPPKAPRSASIKYGAADEPWDYRIPFIR
jgi:hypothetical protein